ncbi:MAG: hypothetical protein GOU97_02510 [Nanoarchaeota archaeon]|nr:hypothetical protein [Nanoarchaeota archaeon]
METDLLIHPDEYFIKRMDNLRINALAEYTSKCFRDFSYFEKGLFDGLIKSGRGCGFADVYFKQAIMSMPRVYEESRKMVKTCFKGKEGLLSDLSEEEVKTLREETLKRAVLSILVMGLEHEVLHVTLNDLGVKTSEKPPSSNKTVHHYLINEIMSKDAYDWV